MMLEKKMSLSQQISRRIEKICEAYVNSGNYHLFRGRRPYRCLETFFLTNTESSITFLQWIWRRVLVNTANLAVRYRQPWYPIDPKADTETLSN